MGLRAVYVQKMRTARVAIPMIALITIGVRTGAVLSKKILRTVMTVNRFAKRGYWEKTSHMRSPCLRKDMERKR